DGQALPGEGRPGATGATGQVGAGPASLRVALSHSADPRPGAAAGGREPPVRGCDGDDRGALGVVVGDDVVQRVREPRQTGVVAVPAGSAVAVGPGLDVGTHDVVPGPEGALAGDRREICCPGRAVVGLETPV